MVPSLSPPLLDLDCLERCVVFCTKLLLTAAYLADFV